MPVSALTRMGSSLPPLLSPPGSGPALPPCPPLPLPVAGPARQAPRFSTAASARARGRGLRGAGPAAAGSSEGRSRRRRDLGSTPSPPPRGWGRGCHVPSADSSCKTASVLCTPSHPSGTSTSHQRQQHRPSIPRAESFDYGLPWSSSQRLPRPGWRLEISCLQGP